MSKTGSEFFWLIVGAVAALSLAKIATDPEGIKAEIPIPFLGEKLIGALSLFLIAVALLLIKVVTWLAQQEKLIEILGKIIQGVFSAKTFWLIMVALAIFGVVAMFLVTDQPPNELSWPQVIALGAVALILGKVVVWIVKRVVDRYFV